MTVSLIGEGFGMPAVGAGTGAAGVRTLGLIEPVGIGSGRLERAEARDSSVICRLAICSSRLSNCS